MTFRNETLQFDDEDWDILEAAYTEHTFRLVPSRWQNFSKLATLNWSVQLFSDSNAITIPASSGIYSFCVEPNLTDNLAACFLMYFGKANNLRRRYGEYIREIRAPKGVGRPSIKRLKYYKSTGYLYFHFAEIDPAMAVPQILDTFLLSVEKSLITAFAPPVNSQITDAQVRRVESAFD